MLSAFRAHRNPVMSPPASANKSSNDVSTKLTKVLQNEFAENFKLASRQTNTEIRHITDHQLMALAEKAKMQSSESLRANQTMIRDRLIRAAARSRDENESLKEKMTKSSRMLYKKWNMVLLRDLYKEIEDEITSKDNPIRISDREIIDGFDIIGPIKPTGIWPIAERLNKNEKPPNELDYETRKIKLRHKAPDWQSNSLLNRTHEEAIKVKRVEYSGPSQWHKSNSNQSTGLESNKENSSCSRTDQSGTEKSVCA